ncbi:uncharacterized protein BO80DRAFT_432050 [Aspergillus ibericus CBS 121593]|uniref:Uncharacterized protein n=1 Tax=Aspergillus ibericus CBS 121593 TaxID=1448316 RepID=A0A395HDQ4_9EURO|nr:hypothetical protein BO80DRAFT_432050 [Aspergillus ibericus CBS 121593]RAL04354.1 hypothetical protein BO80DRAFT_432050 [Aspergillus ibericus CBS 121593]
MDGTNNQRSVFGWSTSFLAPQLWQSCSAPPTVPNNNPSIKVEDTPHGFTRWAYNPFPYRGLSHDAPYASYVASGSGLGQPAAEYPAPNFDRPSLPPQPNSPAVEPRDWSSSKVLLAPSPSKSVVPESSRAPTLPKTNFISLKSQKCPRRLASTKLCKLSQDEVLFFYGALATQALLLPRFQFYNTKDSRWGVKLTMYGFTITKSNIYPSQRAAKADVCLAALKKLQAEYPEWILPDEEQDGPVTSGWDWIELLRVMAEYCVQNGIPGPAYTKFLPERGDAYCHGVKVRHATYTGPMDHYASDHVSQNTSAYKALQTLLVHGSGEACNFPGPFTLKRHDEKLLADVPRFPGFVNHEADSRLSVASKTRAKPESNSPRPERSKKRKLDNEGSGNSNLLPLTNCRLSSTDVRVQEEEKRWKLTPQQLATQIGALGSYVDKLTKVCELLELEHPEVRVDRLDGRLVETQGDYTAGAYFKNDPFLTRAGAIGHIISMQGTKFAVEEACAQKVVDYLMTLVQEDYNLEEAAAEERRLIEQWGKGNKRAAMG